MSVTAILEGKMARNKRLLHGLLAGDDMGYNKTRGERKRPQALRCEVREDFSEAAA